MAGSPCQPAVNKPQAAAGAGAMDILVLPSGPPVEDHAAGGRDLPEPISVVDVCASASSCQNPAGMLPAQ